MSRLAVTGAAAAAAVLARRGAELAWRTTRGGDPPRAADVDDDRDLRDLLVWSALLAGSVVLAQRLATTRARRLLGD